MSAPRPAEILPRWTSGVRPIRSSALPRPKRAGMRGDSIEGAGERQDASAGVLRSVMGRRRAAERSAVSPPHKDRKKKDPVAPARADSVAPAAARLPIPWPAVIAVAACAVVAAVFLLPSERLSSGYD